MCHNQADALDLTQSALLKALESLPRFRGGASFYTWLFRIAVNLVLSHRRSRQRRAVASLNETHGQDEGRRAVPGAREAQAGAAAEQHELQERVAWALEQLDDEFRTAVVLKDIEDMDYAQIAAVLGVPVGTVKSRIHRGRLMLRELLHAERTHVGGS
jgi:RNA polymerase sigma-70 factor (ECF subfamily)